MTGDAMMVPGCWLRQDWFRLERPERHPVLDTPRLLSESQIAAENWFLHWFILLKLAINSKSSKNTPVPFAQLSHP